MSGHPLYGQVPGGVSGPGGDTSDGMDIVEDTRREVGIHLSDDDMGVGWVLYDGEIHQTVPEHRHTIYRYVITVRPL